MSFGIEIPRVENGGAILLGDAAKFPVGNGALDHAANQTQLDWQPDGTADLSDAIAGLRFLFLGGPAHVLAIPTEETTGCAQIPGCDGLVECQK
jgi:hypothetical protein